MLLLIIGDDHTVIAYYVLRSESWKELEPGLYFLNDRLERLDTIGDLEAWWSDRCCDGATDVTKHAIVSIFKKSKLKRAPRKDKFHAINGVNKTGNEGVPEQKAELGTCLFNALSDIPDSELAPVIAYLRRKDPRMDELSARTKARTEFRHHGIIRSRSWGRGVQLKRWRQARADWAERARRDKERGDRSVIRPKIGKLQGTLEEMECLEPCLKKGCLEDPWPMDQMYVDTKVQPITGLQERLKRGDTNRNESRHCQLNKMVAGVSRMGEDLMEVLLDFAIYLTNRKYDVLFGRLDEHSLSLFPWSDAALDADAAELLEGPPLFPVAAAPRNPLPDVVPISRGDVGWEPLGFEYLRYLQQQEGDAAAAAALAVGKAAVAADAMLDDDDEEAASDEEEPGASSVRRRTVERAAERAAEGVALATAAALTAAGNAPSSPVASPSRKGGSRWSGATKAKAVTISARTPIKPERPGELRACVEALDEARQHEGSTSATAMYERARRLYLAHVELKYSDRAEAPDARELRPNPTTAALLRELDESNVRHALRVEQERTQAGSSSDAIIALPVLGPFDNPPAALPVAALPAPPPAALPTTARALTLPAFDFGAALPLSASQKKRARCSNHDSKQKKAAVIVSRAEVGTIAVRTLLRVAQSAELKQVVRIKRCVRACAKCARSEDGHPWTTETIRAAVATQWPEGQESITLPGGDGE